MHYSRWRRTGSPYKVKQPANQHVGQTHCAFGHRLEGANVITTARPGGRKWRECKECRVIRRAAARSFDDNGDEGWAPTSLEDHARLAVIIARQRPLAALRVEYADLCEALNADTLRAKYDRLVEVVALLKEAGTIRHTLANSGALRPQHSRLAKDLPDRRQGEDAGDEDHTDGEPGEGADPELAEVAAGRSLDAHPRYPVHRGYLLMVDTAEGHKVAVKLVAEATIAGVVHLHVPAPAHPAPAPPRHDDEP